MGKSTYFLLVKAVFVLIAWEGMGTECQELSHLTPSQLNPFLSALSHHLFPLGSLILNCLFFFCLLPRLTNENVGQKTAIKFTLLGGFLLCMWWESRWGHGSSRQAPGLANYFTET